jgi:hypothetical protein
LFKTLRQQVDSPVDFEKGFDKAPVGLKKRLVRNTFKQVVLAHDKLAMWFYLDSDDQGRGGNGLKLVRDETSEVGVSIDSGANFGFSKLSDRGLDIGLFGDATSIRTKDLRLRRALLYPAELWHHISLFK